jgi:hypothetical protein
MIEELMAETISRIEAIEGSERRRSTVAKIHFDHAVRHILIELWKSVKTLPVSEVSINKRAQHCCTNCVQISKRNG